MTFVRKFMGPSICGILVGASLAIVAPSRALADGCTCNDDGSGHYKCNISQTACIAGTESCATLCSDPEIQ